MFDVLWIIVAISDLLSLESLESMLRKTWQTPCNPLKKVVQLLTESMGTFGESWNCQSLQQMGGGSKYFIIFTPKIGEDEPIFTHIFQMGWFNHHPETDGLKIPPLHPWCNAVSPSRKSVVLSCRGSWTRPGPWDFFRD